MSGLIKKLIGLLLMFNIDLQVYRKFRKISHTTGFTKDSSLKNLARQYKNSWKGFYFFMDGYYPVIYSRINKIASPDYIPENVYYSSIEPVLNHRAYTPAYADKNFYEHYLPEYSTYFPETVLRGINRNFFTKNYERIKNENEIIDILLSNPLTEYILKPATETSGGNLVATVKRTENEFYFNGSSIDPGEMIKKMKETYRMSFVFQERIRQFPWFSDFNPSSLNTLRIFTYRSVSNEEVHILHVVLRFGKPGSLVDNQASGGLSAGVSKEGRLNSFAIDKYGNHYSELEVLKQKGGQEVPGLQEMKELARKIASRYHYHRLLGFDFCFTDEKKIKLLEINCKNIETNFLQMNNGPLLGSFSSEIKEYCKKNKKNIVLDFAI
jgi:hypothetical protein